ncbi:hypothetical protein PanWU01x14_338900 [Parasponia andersonii]|uniref:Uncharacterized protein n=1 Tax=Parasponia andersonii TaxID=3476 RepID=A0A2P5AEZ4_PARAD|nr:hypothetical protein PanWU01x14_338900 [Parasponia andersonii]
MNKAATWAMENQRHHCLSSHNASKLSENKNVRDILAKSCKLPIAKEHLDELKTISSVDVQRRHLDEFSSWFEKRIKDLPQTEPTKVTDELNSLACGPDSKVNRYHGCMVDGVKFLIQEKDEHKVTRNSVVCSLDLHGDLPLDFYGILCSVLELNYKSGYRAILFKCKPFADRKLDGRKNCFTTANIQFRDLNHGDHHVFVLADQAVHAFDLDVKYGRVNIQRLQHRLFWDALETTTDEEVVEDATVNRTLDTCNFEWAEHVSDIRTRGFVHTSLEPEVINAGVVPNLSGEAVHDQGEMFDDPWIDKPTFYMSSRSSEKEYFSSDADIWRGPCSKASRSTLSPATLGRKPVPHQQSISVLGKDLQ